MAICRLMTLLLTFRISKKKRRRQTGRRIFPVVFQKNVAATKFVRFAKGSG